MTDRWNIAIALVWIVLGWAIFLAACGTVAIIQEILGA